MEEKDNELIFIKKFTKNDFAESNKKLEKDYKEIQNELEEFKEFFNLEKEKLQNLEESFGTPSEIENIILELISPEMSAQSITNLKDDVKGGRVQTIHNKKK